jgi:hypothetical protein
VKEVELRRPVSGFVLPNRAGGTVGSQESIKVNIKSEVCKSWSEVKNRVLGKVELTGGSVDVVDVLTRRARCHERVNTQATKSSMTKVTEEAEGRIDQEKGDQVEVQNDSG